MRPSRHRIALVSALASAALAGLLATASCAGPPHPGPVLGVDAPAGRPGSATGEAASVRVVLDGDAWRGYPTDLAYALTPIEVAVHNESEHHIQLTHRWAWLVDGDGMAHRAVDPLALSTRIDLEHAAQHLAASRYGMRRVAHGRSYELVPRGLPTHEVYRPWRGGLWHRPLFHDPFYDVSGEGLPSDDMLRDALPEGVLEAGGWARGFAYFPVVGDAGETIMFRLRVVDDDTGEVLGEINIPMVYQ